VGPEQEDERMQIGKMMKQAQKMMKDMEKAKAELANRTVEASAGGGMVTVQVSGDQRILSVKIDPQCVDPQDVAMLEDLVMAAVNDALRQAAKMTEQEMGRFTTGLNLPF
jgi:DNA-binding YbaB/EbfC family protein